MLVQKNPTIYPIKPAGLGFFGMVFWTVVCVSVGSEMTELADKLNFDREVIRVWFCNKRQTLKNSAKKLNISPPHYS